MLLQQGAERNAERAAAALYLSAARRRIPATKSYLYSHCRTEVFVPGHVGRPSLELDTL